MPASASALRRRTGRSAGTVALLKPSPFGRHRWRLYRASHGHGPLPDSGRERIWMRQKAAHSMMTAAVFNACRRRSDSADSASMLTKGDAVSRGGSGQARPVEHPGRHFQPPIRVRAAQRAAEDDAIGLVDRLMDRQPAAQTTDANDKAVLGKRSRGRSQTLLYNTKRPHSALGYRPPAPVTIEPKPTPLDEAANMQ